MTTLAEKMTEYAHLKATVAPALEAEIDRLKTVNAELVAALNAFLLVTNGILQTQYARDCAFAAIAKTQA